MVLRHLQEKGPYFIYLFYMSFLFFLPLPVFFLDSACLFIFWDSFNDHQPHNNIIIIGTQSCRTWCQVGIKSHWRVNLGLAMFYPLLSLSTPPITGDLDSNGDLHWLTVHFCARFKVLVSTYKALNSLGPWYWMSEFLPRSAALHRPHACRHWHLEKPRK